MGATMTTRGTHEVAYKVRNVGRRAENLMPVWPRVGVYLRSIARQQFATQGARLGKPWKPLKPEYRLWKLRHGYSQKILQQTGAMRKTFVSSPMQIEEYRPSSARFGSRDQKAVWHQYGTRRHGKRVNPPRPILFVTPEVRREVKKMIADYIAGNE